MAAPSRRASAIAVAAVPAATVAANVTSYVLLLTAAHVLGKAAYGQLSSLLGLLLVATVPMLALQTVAARRIATGDETDAVVSAVAIIGAGTALLTALLSPALAAFLHLSSPTGPLLVACCVPATALLGAAQGVAQGRRDFRRLALLILLTTGGRSVGGLIGLALGRTGTSTMLGVLAGSVLAAILVAGEAARTPLVRAPCRSALTNVLREAAHASHGHGIFLLLTSLDVLLARHVLDADAAGVYAVGSVVTRAALWLPQSVVLLAFASLARADSNRRAARRASAVVCAIGAVVVVATALLNRLVVTIVGGGKYHALDSTVWLFATLGSLLALLQLALLAGLAVRDVRATALLWATALTDVVLVLSIGHRLDATRLVSTLVVVASAAALTGLWLIAVGRRRKTPSTSYSAAPVGHDPAV